MDLLDAIEEKRFLGQEFLIWLWCSSEERGGSVAVPGRGDVPVVFEKHMLLECGEGAECEKLVCRGQMTELKEARAGLALGKRPEQARLKIGSEEREYSFTLTAATLEFRSMKLPATAGEDGGGDDRAGLEGQILERVSLIEEGIELVNALFRRFLTVRTSDGWPNELAKLRQWISNGAELATADA
jgi:recombination associated protein RdgC